MFQTFKDISDSSHAAERVRGLRRQMRKWGVSGYLVPRADEFLGEYVPPHAERLSWLTGFSGSAGQAVILLRKAALFVDGRYRLQARDQVDTGLFELCQVPQTRVEDWLKQKCRQERQNRI